MDRCIAALPLADVLKEPAEIASVWSEQAGTLLAQARERRALATAVREGVDAVNGGTATPEARAALHAALAALLAQPESIRLALYLPFQTLPEPGETGEAASALRKTYLAAWDALLSAQDVRANFVDGDVVETRAAAGPPERIVKAAHLAPFLVRRGLLTPETLAELLELETDPVLCRSLIDAVDAMTAMGQPIPASLELARSRCEKRLPERYHTPEPTEITPARAAWLRQRAQGIPRPGTRPALDLSAPLSTRMASLEPEIAEAAAFAAGLDPETTFGVVFLGGSRLKGYGKPDSDVDLCVLTRSGSLVTETGATAISASAFDHPERFAHEVFNTVWVGPAERVAALRRALGLRYFTERDAARRAMTLERLEQDLLQYRLMHKGWPRLFPDSDPALKGLASIDGASAFYERDYRAVAAKLFADNVFMPAL